MSKEYPMTPETALGWLVGGLPTDMPDERDDEAESVLKAALKTLTTLRSQVATLEAEAVQWKKGYCEVSQAHHDKRAEWEATEKALRTQLATPPDLSALDKLADKDSAEDIDGHFYIRREDLRAALALARARASQHEVSPESLDEAHEKHMIARRFCEDAQTMPPEVRAEEIAKALADVQAQYRASQPKGEA